MEFLLAILVGVGVDHLLSSTTHFSEHLCSSAGWSAGLSVIVLSYMFHGWRAKQAYKNAIKKKSKELTDLYVEDTLMQNSEKKSNKEPVKEIHFKF